MVKTTLTDGSPVTDGHREINPETGMQKGYVVLSEEERAKGFVEPVRRSYRHAGRDAPKTLRPLTTEEAERYADCHYVGFEEYGPESLPVTGRFWKKHDLDRLGGCGVVTTMSQPLAETYARDPYFYSGTFCSGCGAHFPVGEDGEFVWDGTNLKVGERHA